MLLALLPMGACGLMPLATPAPLRRPHAALAVPTSARVRMSGFSLGDALKGSFERLTDFRVARASHILLKSLDDATLETMRRWKAEIADDPDKFAEIARTSSQCPSSIKGECGAEDRARTHHATSLTAKRPAPELVR